MILTDDSIFFLILDEKDQTHAKLCVKDRYLVWFSKSYMTLHKKNTFTEDDDILYHLPKFKNHYLCFPWHLLLFGLA